MVLIATTDPQLAKRLGEAIADEKRYLLKSTTPEALRHEVYSTQPEVLILDATFGGNAFRALESVPNIIRQTTSMPAVILLTPWASTAVEREAAKSCCYDVVNVDEPALKRRVSKIVAAAFSARAAGDFSWLPSKREVH